MTQPHLRSRAVRQAGLTLIELMVAVLLAAILTAGVFNLMIGQTRTYDGQLKSTVMQENVTAAMEYLQRQIRMAGFGITYCPGKVEKWNGSTFVSGLIPMLVSDGGAGGSDVLEVFYPAGALTDPNMGMMAISKHPVASEFIESSSCGGLLANDFFMVAAPGADPPMPCTMLKATKIDDNGKVGDKAKCKIHHNPSDPANPSGGTLKTHIGSKDYPPNAVVIKIGAGDGRYRFRVDTSVNPPRLVQDKLDVHTGATLATETVADGIEDMQVAYTCNAVAGEGPAAALGTDQWYYNTGSETTLPTNCITNCVDPGCRNFEAVRVTLVVRSAGPESGFKGKRPAVENRTVGAADNYMRATLTTTLKPRNIHPSP